MNIPCKRITNIFCNHSNCKEAEHNFPIQVQAGVLNMAQQDKNLSYIHAVVGLIARLPEWDENPALLQSRPAL